MGQTRYAAVKQPCLLAQTACELGVGQPCMLDGEEQWSSSCACWVGQTAWELWGEASRACWHRLLVSWGGAAVLGGPVCLRAAGWSQPHLLAQNDCGLGWGSCAWGWGRLLASCGVEQAYLRLGQTG